MMPLDKNGQPYEPMTEAQKAAARRRPYPEEVMRTTAMIERRRAQIAAEPPRVHRALPEDERPVETLGAAISRKAKVTRRRKSR
jgi:hypothetical protein